MISATSMELIVSFSSAPSVAARRRMLSRRWEPLFIAGWLRVLMMHFEVDVDALQRDVPFQLDLYQGRAFLTLVAFTMRGMRPRWGGKPAAWLFRPLATHHFLNVRTYVRQGGEPGIHFLTEWVSSRLAVKLGPTAFGLPYRHGQIDYNHNWPSGVVSGQVTDINSDKKLAYHAELTESADFHAFQPCPTDSLDEWLMERYTAFNSAGGRKRFFRVWHPPWPQQTVNATVLDNSLLTHNWSWFGEAKLVRANFSPGFDEVWMGRPHRVNHLKSSPCMWSAMSERSDESNGGGGSRTLVP
ncbi:MAG TPA: DUF2071 domain-containing protein [Phycisphaerae bacterium]|nr:DUF2071 domain-containing protein [Phycisphaerae bacterium]